MFVVLKTKPYVDILSEIRKIMLGLITKPEDFDSSKIDIAGTYVNIGSYGQPGWPEQTTNMYRSPLASGGGYKYLQFVPCATNYYTFSLSVCYTNLSVGSYAYTWPTHPGFVMQSALSSSMTNAINIDGLLPIASSNSYVGWYKETGAGGSVISFTGGTRARICTSDVVLVISASANHFFILPPNMTLRLPTLHYTNAAHTTKINTIQNVTVSDGLACGYVDVGGVIDPSCLAAGEVPFRGFVCNTIGAATSSPISFVIQNKYNFATQAVTSGNTLNNSYPDSTGIRSYGSINDLSRIQVPVQSLSCHNFVNQEISARNASTINLSDVMDVKRTALRYGVSYDSSTTELVDGYGNNWYNAYDVALLKYSPLFLPKAVKKNGHHYAQVGSSNGYYLIRE